MGSRPCKTAQQETRCLCLLKCHMVGITAAAGVSVHTSPPFAGRSCFTRRTCAVCGCVPKPQLGFGAAKQTACRQQSMAFARASYSKPTGKRCKCPCCSGPCCSAPCRNSRAPCGKQTSGKCSACARQVMLTLLRTTTVTVYSQIIIFMSDSMFPMIVQHHSIDLAQSGYPMGSCGQNYKTTGLACETKACPCNHTDIAAYHQTAWC